MDSNPTSQQGLTLVEAAVVVAIVAISVTAAVPSLQRLLEQRRLDAAASELAATLQLARNESIARNRVVRFAHDEINGCHLLHTGAAGACRYTPQGGGECASGATLIRSAGSTAGSSREYSRPASLMICQVACRSDRSPQCRVLTSSTSAEPVARSCASRRSRTGAAS